MSENPQTNFAMLGDDFTHNLGPPNSGFSIFLADRTKKIHFIRHAEGHHNVATGESGTNDCLLHGPGEPGSAHAMYDARLTAKGIAQAEALKEHLRSRPSGGRSFTAFDLVVCSPLTRTLETALHIFGEPRTPGVPVFMDEGVDHDGSGERVPKPHILVREECRERWGKYVCDGRRPIHVIAPEFPGFDFSELEHDEDIFYLEDAREPDEDCCARAVEFLTWLNRRPEKCIAVVTHSSFLRHLFGQFGGTLAADDRDGLQRMAGNCELRSVVLCSHGNRDGKQPENMKPTVVNRKPFRKSVADSTVVM